MFEVKEIIRSIECVLDVNISKKKTIFQNIVQTLHSTARAIFKIFWNEISRLL